MVSRLVLLGVLVLGMVIGCCGLRVVQVIRELADPKTWPPEPGS